MGILVYKYHKIKLHYLPKFLLWSLSVIYHGLLKMEIFNKGLNKGFKRVRQ